MCFYMLLFIGLSITFYIRICYDAEEGYSDLCEFRYCQSLIITHVAEQMTC